MKKELNTQEKKIQKILNKLISEEIVANHFYNGCINAINVDERRIIKKLFKEIAEDELNDHMKKLCDWAESNGYKSPFSFNDYEKYAEKCTKQLNSLKKDQNFAYYMDQALESEKDAIESYQEVIDDTDIPCELKTICLNNYYDEQEHFQKLTTLILVINSGMEMGEY